MKRDFFRGRYGVDPLSVFLLFLAVPFVTRYYLWIVAIALVAVVVYRALSRNVEKRRRELYRFTGLMQRFLFALMRFFGRIRKFGTRIAGSFSYTRRRFRERKDYVYFKCPNCRKILRLPRHKGKLAVTCPVCRHTFQKKT